MWHKQGIIFNEQHAQLPTVQVIDDKFRVFYSSKINNQSAIYYFDILADDPTKITARGGPVLTAGERGCFDDSGVMPSCVCDNLLYYTGWNCDKGQVPYGHGIGIAMWSNGEFKRLSQGPILDRNRYNPFLVNSPYVQGNNMWYCQGTGWDGSFPTYCIAKTKWITATDPHWSKPEIVLGNQGEAVSRIWVCGDKMWYGYRTKSTGYKIGFALNNQRMDDGPEALQPSEFGWDSEMVSYPCVLNYNEQTYMFYNGNGYGATGIGWAIWQQENN